MPELKLSESTVVTNLAATDQIVVITDPSGSPDNGLISKRRLFANVHVVTVFTANTTVSGQLMLPTGTPSSNSASAEGKSTNSIWADDDYLYVATSDGSIKRVGLSLIP